MFHIIIYDQLLDVKSRYLNYAVDIDSIFIPIKPFFEIGFKSKRKEYVSPELSYASTDESTTKKTANDNAICTSKSNNVDLKISCCYFFTEGALKVIRLCGYDLMRIDHNRAPSLKGSSSYNIFYGQQRLNALEKCIDELGGLMRPTGKRKRQRNLRRLQILTEIAHESPWLLKENLIQVEREMRWEGLGNMNGGPVVFPRNSSFYWGGIRCGLESIGYSLKSNRPFKVLLADPPWCNRSVTRGGGGSYRTSSFTDLLRLSSLVRPLMVSGPSVCGIWSTNSPSVLTFVRTRLLPAWGYRFVVCWPWVKLAGDGRPICPATSSHKKPLELLLVGISDSGEQPESTESDAGGGPDVTVEALLGELLQWDSRIAELTENDFVKQCLVRRYPPPTYMDLGAVVPEAKIDEPGEPVLGSINTHAYSVCLVSSPLRHSWKPAVGPLLEDFLAHMTSHQRRSGAAADSGGGVSEPGSDRPVLELFARELCPGTVSVGDQVLLHQLLSPQGEESGGGYLMQLDHHS